MTDQRNGRTRQERRNADDLKARRLQPCRRCGQPINYNADPQDPESFNAGHIKAWRDYPDLRGEPSNLSPEHASCNKSAHTRDSADNGIGVVSTDW